MSRVSLSNRTSQLGIFFRSIVVCELKASFCYGKSSKEAFDILCNRNDLKEAVQSLERIERPSQLVYSRLLGHCLRYGAIEEAKTLHHQMRSSDFSPCLPMSNKLLHLYTTCGSFDDALIHFNQINPKDLCSWNTLLSGYTKVGKLEEAIKLFEEMPQRDAFSWNAMISGYVRYGQPDEALNLCRNMNLHDSHSKHFTLSILLSAAASISSLRIGMEIHGHIMRSSLSTDRVICTTLSAMYGKCGNVEQARAIFDMIEDKDVVAWTSMIGKYLSEGKEAEGFALFTQMLNSDSSPNDFTLSTVLNACSTNAMEECGKQVHAFMIRNHFNFLSSSSTALIHMYSKCGNIEFAKNVFYKIPNPDLFTWTAMINGCAQNGHPHEALTQFSQMLKSKSKPDHVTFVGVLSACVHAGLVEQGLYHFNSMKRDHNVAPRNDHYTCVIDLLSRSGRFTEAERMIERMSVNPDKYLWAAVLNGCRIHKNVNLAEKAAEKLYEMEAENPATYVAMGNIYASAGMWRKVERERKRMRERGVVKKAGKSWIKVKRKLHVFTAGDCSHERFGEMMWLLRWLGGRMKEAGFSADGGSVLHDVEEEQREEDLIVHSEKLAVAFGMIATPQGTPLKVYKNLRTCGDCHNAFKFISMISGRKITVRDSFRFHCFQHGECSCRDFW